VFEQIECNTPDKCIFTESPSMSTFMYYPPRYNRKGENLNPDGNTTTSTIGCETCGKRFTQSQQYGESTIREIT